MDRKKWLLLIPAAVMISGIIVLQNIPKRGEETYIYLDDVSIAVNGVTVFQDDARNETATERWKTIENAHTTEDAYLSPLRPSPLGAPRAGKEDTEPSILG